MINSNLFSAFAILQTVQSNLNRWSGNCRLICECSVHKVSLAEKVVQPMPSLPVCIGWVNVVMHWTLWLQAKLINHPSVRGWIDPNRPISIIFLLQLSLCLLALAIAFAQVRSSALCNAVSAIWPLADLLPESRLAFVICDEAIEWWAMSFNWTIETKLKTTPLYRGGMVWLDLVWRLKLLANRLNGTAITESTCRCHCSSRVIIGKKEKNSAKCECNWTYKL